MSYGLEVRNASGGVVFNTGTHIGAVYAGQVECPTGDGQTSTFEWPSFVGKTGLAFYFPRFHSAVHVLTWQYPGGVPTLSITKQIIAGTSGAGGSVLVFMQ